MQSKPQHSDLQPEELKEYLKAEAGKAQRSRKPGKAEASEPVQKDGSEQ